MALIRADEQRGRKGIVAVFFGKLRCVAQAHTVAEGTAHGRLCQHTTDAFLYRIAFVDNKIVALFLTKLPQGAQPVLELLVRMNVRIKKQNIKICSRRRQLLRRVAGTGTAAGV